MENAKVRKIRFWIGTNHGGTAVTARNKKLLRDQINAQGKENFKGTKIRQFEVQYDDHADLALKLMSSSSDSLMMSSYASVISEYDA